ncbi:hypothetical protein [Posidoniimonas corsicana]|uniref:hypothetical protein n=1 Tax=Posidoniimonas corsicana TaxID=1938618 RepID=UPI0011B7CBFF|nr:hypothetical protein [Posidoniimonas corsicana]
MDGPDTVWIDIPRNRWHGVVDAFLPSAADPEPVPWEISGWVEIVTATETVRVMFSAGDDVLFRVKDQYYQGGDGEELLRQLSDAR